MEKLKNGIKISAGQVVFELNQNMQKYIVLINNSRTGSAYWNLNAIFEFLRQFALECIILLSCQNFVQKETMWSLFLYVVCSVCVSVCT